MNSDYMLNSASAKKFYAHIKSLPIIDYHCHLSPKEIFLDEPFENIGRLWLAGDHYKWRLMRSAGIQECFITGNASWHEKFLKYAQALELAPGNPLYHWSHMELSYFFGIETYLNDFTADEIWQKANSVIAESKLSPRKLIKQCGVELLCTTDDPTDDLSYHIALKNDKSFKTRVIPSFRTDNLLLILREGYGNYIKRLSEVSGVWVTDLASFKRAIEARLNFFVQNGCRFTDVGIPYFPNTISSDEKADECFKTVLSGGSVSEGDYLGFIGNMYLFLAELYSKNGLVMQWHLSVYRNANSRLYDKLGADCGADCIGDTINTADITAMLDSVNSRCTMPQTIIYTLNPSSAVQLSSVAGSFPNVRCGAAWWFCDHKRGIEEELKVISEQGTLGTFLGMLTDSRSFLSYVRHDYFRRILCSFMGNLAENGEYDISSVKKILEKICYYNIKELIGE